MWFVRREHGISDIIFHNGCESIPPGELPYLTGCAMEHGRVYLSNKNNWTGYYKLHQHSGIGRYVAWGELRGRSPLVKIFQKVGGSAPSHYLCFDTAKNHIMQRKL